MKKITLLLSFIFCGVLANAQTNLVVNPGFETWTDASTPGANWTPTLAASQTFSQEAIILHSGTYSILSNHTGTSGTAKIVTKPYIVVTAGLTYTFSFWYYTDASTTNLTGGLRMWGYWENPDGSNGTFDQTGLQPTAYIDLTSSIGSWKQFSVDITAPTGSGQLELDIRFYHNTKIYIDDVSLVQKTTGISTPSADILNVSLAGKILTVTNSPSNTIEIFNTVGAKVQTAKLTNNSTELNLSRGLYIVRVGNKSAKIRL
jgi:hypothetical protein